MTEKGWFPECEQCQELSIIKGRCETYRLQTIELKRKLKEANVQIDQLQKINKANNQAAKEDVQKLQQLVKDQNMVIENCRLMLKLGKIK